MLPILIKIGPITIHTYGFLFAIGVLLGIILSTYLAKKEGINKDDFSNLLFYTLLIALLGAKLLLVITNLSFYLKRPSELKFLLTSGGTFYGGLIGGILFAIFYIKKKKLDYRVIGDITGPSIALGHFFGRLGCFSAGCCYGRFAGESPLAVKFPNLHQQTGVPTNTPIYPTQLMEAILNLLNFIILFFIYKKRKFKGQIFLMYIFNYSIIRFIVEYFRGDPDRGYIFGNYTHPFSSLSVPQFISIIGIISVSIFYPIFKRKGEKEKESNS